MDAKLIPVIALLIFMPAIAFAIPKTKPAPMQQPCHSPDLEICALLKS
jgi:hypothetical protein